MQAVDPSVSLPYWDFTYDRENDIVVQKASIFSEEMFGTITMATDSRWGWTYSNDDIIDAAISNGRWKYIKTSMIPDRFKDTLLDAGYSYLRAPWNLNPSPYVSRFSAYSSELPSCSDYYRWAANTDLSTFLSDAPYGPHAATHGVIGSVMVLSLLLSL